MSDIHLPIEEGETPAPSKTGDKKRGEFNPKFMYGEYVYYPMYEECPKLALDWVNEDVASFIPYDYMCRVEIIHKEKVVIPQDPLNMYNSVGWKYTPETLETPKGNEMTEYINSRIPGSGGGMMSYKKNGYRYSIQKTKVDNE